MSCSVSALCHQVIKACELIDDLECNIGAFQETGSGELAELYRGLQIDELEHVQVLAIQLTRELTQGVEVNQDEGSAFGPSELDYVKGKEDCSKTDEQNEWETVKA